MSVPLHVLLLGAVLAAAPPVRANAPGMPTALAACPADSGDAVIMGYGTAALRRSKRDPEPKGDWASLCLPLKRAGNLLLVEARVDSLVGNFILDFGAPYLVLNRTYFRDYETRRSGLQASGVDGGERAVERITVDRLEMETLHWLDVEADLANLGAIEDRRGVQILGLMGLDLFLDLAVTIDPLQSVLTLQRLDENGAPTDPDAWDGRSPGMRTEIRVQEKRILLEGRVAGKRLGFLLDTGAEANVLDNNNASKVLRAVRIERRVPLHGSAGGRAEALAGELGDLELGGRIFPGGKTLIADLDGLGITAGGGIQGMLGLSFLEQGVVRLNFFTETLHWYPFVEGAPVGCGGGDTLGAVPTGP